MHGYHSVKVRVCNDSPKVACGQSKIKSALTFFPFSGHQNQHVHFLKLDGTTQTCLSRFHGSSSVLVLYFFHTVMVHIWLQHHPLVNQIVRTNTDLIKWHSRFTYNVAQKSVNGWSWFFFANSLLKPGQTNFTIELSSFQGFSHISCLDKYCQRHPKFPPIFLRYIYRFSLGDHYTRHRHRRAGENTKICFLHVFFSVCFYLFNSYSAAMNRVSFVVLLFIACTNAYYVTIDAHAEEW